MIPSYVSASLTDKDKINHEWSDWDPYELIPDADADTIKALSSVSLSGMLSFVIGCLEWVTYRCSYDNEYTLPFEYIEAFWVYVAGIEDAIPEEVTDDDRWEGPLDGPINLLIGKFYSTIQTFEFGGSPVEAAFSAKVALHVLYDSEPFLLWQSEVLKRLNKYSPSDGSEEDFNPVVQQILNQDLDYMPDQVNERVKEMLMKIDYKSNRFLAGIGDQLLEYAAKL